MMIIPNPIKEEPRKAETILIVNELYCPEGHNLVSGRAVFNGYPGILLKVRKEQTSGLVALSPIYGEKCRISIDIDLQSGEIYELYCPQCNVVLPAHSPCSCGANLVTLFLSPNKDFSDCIGICNRVDCTNSKIMESGKLISLSMVDTGRYV
jgi:hypothetical protein